MANDEPVPGVQYRLTGPKNVQAISNGHSWAQSVIRTDQNLMRVRIDAQRKHWSLSEDDRIRELALLSMYDALRHDQGRSHSEICTVFMARGICKNEPDFEACMLHLDNLPLRALGEK